MKKYGMNKRARFGFGIFAITVSGLALADCPNTMPSQLLQDCITYEGAGSTFPTSDYANMDLYNKWQNEQQSGSTNQLTGESKR